MPQKLNITPLSFFLNQPSSTQPPHCSRCFSTAPMCQTRSDSRPATRSNGPVRDAGPVHAKRAPQKGKKNSVQRLEADSAVGTEKKENQKTRCVVNVIFINDSSNDFPTGLNVPSTGLKRPSRPLNVPVRAGSPS